MMSTISSNKGCIGKIVETIAQIIKVFRIFYHAINYERQVRGRADLMKLIGFKIGPSEDNSDGVWWYFPGWPKDWQAKLKECYIAFAVEGKLPIASSLPLSTFTYNNQILYRNTTVARDVYLAQIGHILWLEFGKKVPWSLSTWTDKELSAMLLSTAYFRTLLYPGNNKTVFGVVVSSRTQTTENILSDPRIAFRFMHKEPERNLKLIGSTPSETCAKLTGWFHDYLHHNPINHPAYSKYQFHKNHPLLKDRLIRYKVPTFTMPIYLTPSGCGSASSLFIDLARSVNIPVQKFINILGEAGGGFNSHSGLFYSQNKKKIENRYLLHTDDIYHTREFHNPAPYPINLFRGNSLWNNAWLSENDIQKTSFKSNKPHFNLETTFDQQRHYWEYRSKNMVTTAALQHFRGIGYQTWINQLKNRGGLTEQEAVYLYDHLSNTVKHYGNGDETRGFINLLDGPNSRRGQWCNRTKKC